MSDPDVCAVGRGRAKAEDDLLDLLDDRFRVRLEDGTRVDGLEEKHGAKGEPEDDAVWEVGECSAGVESLGAEFEKLASRVNGLEYELQRRDA